MPLILISLVYVYFTYFKPNSNKELIIIIIIPQAKYQKKPLKYQFFFVFFHNIVPNLAPQTTPTLLFFVDLQ